MSFNFLARFGTYYGIPWLGVLRFGNESCTAQYLGNIFSPQKKIKKNKEKESVNPNMP